MAGDTVNTRTNSFMMAVHCRLIPVYGVTLLAYTVARNAKLGAMGIVAIAAGNAGSEHLALLKWAVVVDLLSISHLPICVVLFMRQRRDQVCGRQPTAGYPVLIELRAPGVTKTTGLNLFAKQSRRPIAVRILFRVIMLPNDPIALVKSNQ